MRTLANNKLSWRIGGKAGYGIMVTGLIFSKVFSRSGYHVFDTVEYPSLIRGGHNFYEVRAEDEEVHSHKGTADILVALNKETVDLHKKCISENGAIIFDSNDTKIAQGETRKDILLYDVPLLEISKKICGKDMMRNTVALGASLAIIDYDFNVLADVLKDIFNDKGNEIVGQNIASAKAGYDHVKDKYKNPFKISMKKISDERKMLITGNEAIAIAAIRAGCKFYSAYPMTPASSILHYMAAHDKRIVVKQTEDEIAAIHAAIGASFVGARSMTATSGGGFCLMTEGLGLAAMTETPLVLVLAQRAGPSTGLATRTEQADLKFALNASQGEFPRIVMAPGDVEECFCLTLKAFNLADKYQVPAIIMTDKHLSESHKAAERFDTSYIVERSIISGDKDVKDDFKRFEGTKTGVSPRTLPGHKGIFRAPSYEHDEHGWNVEGPEDRIIMADKRFRKLKFILNEVPSPKLYGKKNADITIVGWGGTKGAILEAMKLLKEDKVNANFIHFSFISPFKADAVTRMLKSAKKTIIIEQNRTLQLAGIIKENTGLSFGHSFSKSDGRQMLPSEIYSVVKKVLNG